MAWRIWSFVMRTKELAAVGCHQLAISKVSARAKASAAANLPVEASSCSRSKGSAVLVNEFLQCCRRAAADFLNQIIRPGEDTVLMIDGDFTQMLDGEGISLTFGFWFELAIESPRVMPGRRFLTARGHHCQHRVDAHLLVLDLFL